MDRLIVELAKEASASVPPRGQTSFVADFESALASFRDAGYDPWLLLIPVSWRLGDAIGLPPVGRSERGDAEGLVLPSGAGHWYAGRTKGLSVIEWPSVPKDRIYLADLAAFGDWHQLPDAEWLDVEVSAYDADQALALARRADDDAVEARAREFQENVRLQVRERFLVMRRDPEAVLWIEIPEDLRFER
jgi:hypothetical protein